MFVSVEHNMKIKDRSTVFRLKIYKHKHWLNKVVLRKLIKNLSWTIKNKIKQIFITPSKNIKFWIKGYNILS